jgi:hypothetical protein
VSRAFRPRGRRIYNLKLRTASGHFVTLSTETVDRLRADAIAGLVDFLKDANPALLLPVVAGQVSLPELFGTAWKSMRAPETVRALEIEGEGILRATVQDALREARGRLPLPGCVYAIRNPANGAIKIGFATDLKTRVSSIGTSHSERLELLGWVPGDRELERALHGAFNDCHIKGEWFRPHRDIVRWISEALAA